MGLNATIPASKYNYAHKKFKDDVFLQILKTLVGSLGYSYIKVTLEPNIRSIQIQPVFYFLGSQPTLRMC